MPTIVPEFDNTEINNFRTILQQEDANKLNFHGQHQNSSSGTKEIDNEYEIANRAFYATINKFTRQNCTDASKRRSTPYSFLENWHLHSIYSKSQQTLLGITPVKPSVLLSGDDFMFTPPFHTQQLLENEQFSVLIEQQQEQLENEQFMMLLNQQQNNDYYYYYDHEIGEDEEYYDYGNQDDLMHNMDDNDDSNTLFLGEQCKLNITANIYADRQDNNLNAFYPSSTSSLLETPTSPYKTDNPNFMNEDKYYPSLSIFIPTIDDQQQQQTLLDMNSPSPEETDLTDSTYSSLDDQNNSSNSSIDSIVSNNNNNNNNINIIENIATSDDHIYTTNIINRQPQDSLTVVQPTPVTRSYSCISQKSTASSVEDTSSSIISYQSFADLMNNNDFARSRSNSLNSTLSMSSTLHNYGTVCNNIIAPAMVENSIKTSLNARGHEISNQSNTTPSIFVLIWSSIYIYIMHIWQVLTHFFTNLSLQPERQPLL